MCKDTGYELYSVDAEPYYGRSAAGTTVEFARPCTACRRLQKEKEERLRRKAGLPAGCGKARFSDFDWGVYRTPEGRPVPAERQRRFAASFLEDFDRWREAGIGLYVWSRTRGSGKTLLVCALANELMARRGVSVRFCRAQRLLAFDQQRMRGEDEIAPLLGCDLLILDDLGQLHGGQDWLSDVLYRIFDARMEAKLVTLVTSNLPLAELGVDDRVADRMNRVLQSLPLPECCVRAKEAEEEKRILFRSLGLAEG